MEHIIFCDFLFLSRFSFANIEDSEDSKGYLFNTSLPPPPTSQALQRHFTDISEAISAKSLPLHIASSWIQTGNLWFFWFLKAIILRCSRYYLLLKYCKKHLWRSKVFQKLSFSKLSLYCKKVVNSLRKDLYTYSKTCIFCLIRYIDFQKQSVRSDLQVLVKSFKSVFEEVHFIVIFLYQNSIRK